MYGTFEELEAWKVGRTLKKEISILTKSFPESEKYRLIDQIIRSSRSITANIAEGHGRFHYMDNAKFCRNSRGSLQETKDHLITAFDEGYINQQTLDEFNRKIDHCQRLLNGYITFLLKKKNEN